MFTYCNNKKPHLCKVKFCRNRKRKKGKLCAKHDMQKWRSEHRERGTFRVLKDNAKARKIGFSLTFEDFMHFCEKTGYLKRKGVHIDRIDAAYGYHIWNIQALECSENIAKGNRERHCVRYQEYLKRRGSEQPSPTPDIDENCPF